MSATRVDPAVRREIVADPAVGGGNALATALRVSPDVHAPYLHAQRPVRDGRGRDRTELSLAELADLVHAWCAWYVERGVGPRDRVGVYLRDGADNLIHYLALSRLGAIAVPVNGELDPVTVVAHLRRTQVCGVQTDDARLAGLTGAGERETDRFWISSVTGTAPPGTASAPPPFAHVPGDPVLICHTSGTTGEPKPVIWTHGQLMPGVREHLIRLADHAESVILSALPQSHAAAIGYAVLAMLSGVPLVLMSDRDGPAVAAAVDRYRATVVAGFAATFADLSLRGLEAARLDSVERWVSVGDASHHAHVAALVERGRHWNGDRPVRGSMFVDGFGSSELGWGGVLGAISVRGATPPYRCVGTAQPFAEVEVLRLDGTPAAHGEVGLLAVRGPTITPGYWNDSDLTYRSMLNGYWLSGDLAYRDEARRFYHVDRAADAIRTDAGPVYSVLTEEILVAHLPQVADCTVVAAERDGRVEAVALMQLRAGHTAGHTADSLLAAANDVLSGLGKPPLVGVEVVGAGAVIPVGVTGKVLKRRLRSRYAAERAEGSRT
ncbi:class I adenylate-forming enzyme family protein [Amycolatopsis sp. A133]|uniref:class I adenylate-forming enzyme family protein n=1 Tax=Amycolatopsis sp. A133 TaxID=3064472 RepID=UPI0027EDF58B|nr:class I adenylate-forming enzyme family protein [Amycolatopsis sp. A133]MDQ7803469.1 class I adenylate-forming enzyme family protein [Amycolatopsis sp. A133]